MFLENHKCKIYNQRPLICQLFPQLKLGNEKNDFCKLDSTDNDHVNRKLYYPVLKNYLSDLKKYGFKDTWKYLPEFKKENIYIIHNSEKIDQDQKILSG
jgi:Fe-S-cluster containining protein